MFKTYIHFKLPKRKHQLSITQFFLVFIIHLVVTLNFISICIHLHTSTLISGFISIKCSLRNSKVRKTSSNFFNVIYFFRHFLKLSFSKNWRPLVRIKRITHFMLCTRIAGAPKISLPHYWNRIKLGVLVIYFFNFLYNRNLEFFCLRTLFM